MSATLPPTANFDRPSDFGEFWQTSEPKLPCPSSLPPEEATRAPLTTEQHARRLRLRRGVFGLVVGLLAFTGVAAGVQAVQHARLASSSASPSQTRAGQGALANAISADPAQAPLPLASNPAPPGTGPLGSVGELAREPARLAFARAPLATAAALRAWSVESGRLSPAEKLQAEHLLSQWSVKGARPAQEAARLGLAILWRGEKRQGRAKTVFLSLARSASEAVVKKFALESLST